MLNLNKHAPTTETNISDCTASQILPSLPNGKNFIVWLSHDVDRVHKSFAHSLYYTVKEMRLSHLASMVSSKNPYWNFKRIMAIEDRYGVKSTFFFLNESMKVRLAHPYSFILAKGRYRVTDPPVREMIRKLDQSGWEVGVHGSYYSFENRELLLHEKNVLEDIVDHPVSGIRQHYLNLNIPDTWRIHQELGFQYDASFGLTDDVGYRNNVCHPFKPFNDHFIVFPLAIMDSALFKKYGSLDNIWKKCLDIIEIAQKNRSVLSLLWHQRVFDEHDFPGYAEIYERIIVECQKRNAQFCTGKDINTYFKA